MKPAPVRQDGYTIIEVMIFLTISAALLVSVIGLFSNRISSTQFSQSVQALDIKIRTIANEVSTGTYPTTPAFNCEVVAGNPTINPTGSGSQGSRTDCVFAGKVLNFGVPSGDCSAPVDDSKCGVADVYTVVGRRVIPATGRVSTSLIGADGARPRIVSDPNITATYDIGYSTHVSGVYRKTPSGLTQVSGIGFFQGFSPSYSSQGDLSSGSQGVETWTVRNTVGAVSPLDIAAMSTVVSTESMTGPATGNDAVICIKNGQRKASITIASAAAGTVTTAVKIGDEQCV